MVNPSARFSCLTLVTISVILLGQYALSALGYCFEELLAKSQSCDNPALMYVSLEGGGSGLGSEFNMYLVYALIDAVRKNKRMVYFNSRRHWEYDCAEKLGWGCYLTFPCNNTYGVAVRDMDFSHERTSVHDRDEVKREYPFLFEKVRDMYNEIKTENEPECKLTPDVKQTYFTSIAAKHLFTPSPQTSRFIKRFNSHYNIQGDYISLQIRAQDKKYEMSAQTWEWITHLSNTYEEIKPYLYPSPNGLKNLYVSTDNCTMLTELSSYLSKEVNVYSPCNLLFHKAAADHLFTDLSFNDGNKDAEAIVGTFNPRKGGYRPTLRLLAEIDMLVNGVHFFGLLNSNLVRMVHRLRSPERQKNTHGLAYHLTSWDFRCRYDTLEF